MAEVKETAVFSSWLRRLRDDKARARIVSRISRLAADHLGDVKALGDKVSEMRIDYGPGYRVYFTRRGRTFYLLLCGGDKSSQDRDIRVAKQLAKELEF